MSITELLLLNLKFYRFSHKTFLHLGKMTEKCFMLSGKMFLVQYDVTLYKYSRHLDPVLSAKSFFVKYVYSFITV